MFQKFNFPVSGLIDRERKDHAVKTSKKNPCPAIQLHAMKSFITKYTNFKKNHGSIAHISDKEFEEFVQTFKQVCVPKFLFHLYFMFISCLIKLTFCSSSALSNHRIPKVVTILKLTFPMNCF